jgi:hypothetical protein
MRWPLWSLCWFPALASVGGCTSWTAVHGGYGLTPGEDRSVAGLEVRQALGGAIHSGYGLVGARVDGGEDQFDAELHVGAMRPLRLSDELSWVPSATIELARISRMDSSWYGGAFGPGLGSELVWWFDSESRPFHDGGQFGCMGGAPGVDCPWCVGEDVTRGGLGVRVAVEHDLRFGSDYPDQNDGIVWFTVGLTRAVSSRENECCYYDHQARFPPPCPRRPR